MGLRRFLLLRFVTSVATLFGIATILFLVVRLMPGDPTNMFIDDASWSNPEAMARQRAMWGLDEPMYVQYLRYLKNLLTLDFGKSFIQGRPVRPIILEKVANTFTMMLPALVLMVLLGSVWGSIAGWRRGSRFESGSVVLSLFLRSIPSFFLGVLVLMVFAYRLGWFPSSGMVTPGSNPGFWSRVLSRDFLAHLVLPVFTLVVRGANQSFLLMRTSIIEIKGEDFLETLWAKGLKERQVLRHAVRNALVPLVTYVAVLVAFLFEGQVLIETIFAWPGIGREIVVSLLDHDYPVAQAAFFLTALVVVSMNFVVDVLYGFLDPRVKYG